MKMPLVRVASMVFNQPLAILPEKLEAILHGIGSRLEVEPTLEWVNNTGTQPLILSQPVVLLDPVPMDQPQKSSKPYQLTSDGIGVVKIQGTLLKRFNFLSAASGCSSYGSIGEAVGSALADPSVKAVLLDVDSPGGTTHGCFELSELLYGMRGDKPIWAIANDLAASAAYALASAADRVFVTRTAGVGSIGVFALHADTSGQDDMQGVKYTYIFAGDKKTDGNPHQPLSKSAKSDIQAEVDREYEMFVQCVARNRDMWPQKVRNTEAGVLFGDTAIGKLADECMSYDEAMAALAEQVNHKMPVARQTISDHNASNGDVTESRRQEDGTVEKGLKVPAIAPHKTATSEKAWDGPKAKANLKNDGTEAYYRSAFAWQDAQGDPTVKASYKFIHHEVSAGGDVGAANIKACQSSIGILNGGRGGTVVSKPDRRGIYRHVAGHLKDAKLEPAPLAHRDVYYAGVLAEALELHDVELHALALQYLLADDAEESTAQGEEPMALDTTGPKDTLIKRGKKTEQDTEAKEPDEEEEDGEDDSDEEEEEEEDDKKKSESKKSEAKGRKSESRRAKDKDDMMESRKSANGAAKRIASLCEIANMPELAVQYIGANYTVDDVIEDLNDRRTKASSEQSMHSYVTGQAPGSGATFDQAVRQAQLASAPFASDPVAYAQARYQAMSQAMRANPQIYESYMDERDRVIQLSPGGRGKVLTEYVLGAQRRYMAQLGLSTAIEDVPIRRSMV
jgi:signal peptide peptidase SppA